MLRQAQHRSLTQIINLLTHEEPCNTLHGIEQIIPEMLLFQIVALKRSRIDLSAQRVLT